MLTEYGTASLADKEGYHVGGNWYAESCGNKKQNKYFYFNLPTLNQIIHYLKWKNPKINQDLIYNFSRKKPKLLTTLGWNSVYVAGK